MRFPAHERPLQLLQVRPNPRQDACDRLSLSQEEFVVRVCEFWSSPRVFSLDFWLHGLHLAHGLVEGCRHRFAETVVPAGIQATPAQFPPHVSHALIAPKNPQHSSLIAFMAGALAMLPVSIRVVDGHDSFMRYVSCCMSEASYEFFWSRKFLNRELGRSCSSPRAPPALREGALVAPKHHTTVPAPSAPWFCWFASNFSSCTKSGPCRQPAHACLCLSPLPALLSPSVYMLVPPLPRSSHSSEP